MVNGFLIEGQHALVTGGSRGIGRAVAMTLKRSGARVTILGRDLSSLDRAVLEGVADERIVADVTNQASVDAALAHIGGGDPVDLLITNAGAAETAPYSRTDVEMISRMMEVNLFGALRFVRVLAPQMVARGHGRIVAVASTAGLKGYGYVSAYVAAKHALVGYVRAVAAEIAKTGVTINAVCPGFTETELVEASLETIMRKTGRSRDEALAELTRHNPQGRLVRADEVADAVLWLCRVGSGALNGQAIAVAGGEV